MIPAKKPTKLFSMMSKKLNNFLSKQPNKLTFRAGKSQFVNLFGYVSCLLLSCYFSLASEEPRQDHEEKEQAVILGGGVGSLTSAIYLARSGHHPMVVEGPSPGGALTQSHSVQNWPGEEEIAGKDLIEKIRKQAESNGVRFLQEEVIEVNFSQRPLLITTRSLDGKKKVRQFKTDTCLIGMGSSPNMLGIPGEREYWGRGVTSCAVCDGSLYEGQIVGVVGGGDAAVTEGLYLSQIAKEVHLFVRSHQLRAKEASRINILTAKPNVFIHYNTKVLEVKGDDSTLNAAVVQTQQNPSRQIPIDGLFLAIGSTPNTKIFQSTLELDPAGYILLKEGQSTSIPGVYALGDIADPVFKQAISAAGDGAKAALQAQNYLVNLPSKRSTKNYYSKELSQTDPSAIEIESAGQFVEELKKADSLVAVDFYATWCTPCKQLSPLFEASAEKHAGKVKFLKVNVNKLPELIESYKVRGMPTLLLFDASGKVLEREVGLNQAIQLLENLGSKIPQDPK